MILAAFAATTAVVILVVLGVAGRRLTRRAQEARLGRTSARHRPLLLAMVAGDPDDAREATAAIADLDARAWQVLEPAVVALLAKVRGESRDEIVRLLDHRGVIDRARRDLHRRRAARRAAAAELLGRTQVPGAVRALVRLLDDRDADVRQVAARALGRMRAVETAPSLLRTLASRSPRVPPATVAQALLRIGAPAVPDLLAAVDHPVPVVRTTVVVVLGRLGAPAAAPALRDRLRTDPLLDVRCLAAAALGALGTPGAVPDLVAATAFAAPASLRVAATRALGDLGAGSTVPVLRALLDDHDARVATEAAAALATLGAGDDPAAAVPVLAGAR